MKIVISDLIFNYLKKKAIIVSSAETNNLVEKGNQKRTGEKKFQSVVLSEKEQKNINDKLNTRKTIATSHFLTTKSEKDSNTSNFKYVFLFF